MTKRVLALKIAAKTGLAQTDVLTVVQSVLDHIAEGLAAGDRFEFREFGVLEVVVRKPRIGRNPHHPEQTVTIPARKTVKFKPGRKMKELLQKSAQS